MDTKERFDQLESLLVDLARKVDQQGEAIARQGEAIAQQGGAIARQGEAIARQEIRLGTIEIRLDNIGEQIGDIITILKISEARHTQAEQRQDVMLAEIQRQGQRLDTSIDALKLLLKRQENADNRLDGVVQAQLQTLELLRADADKVEAIAQRLPAVENQEPRIKRLEDEVFRAAS